MGASCDGQLALFDLRFAAFGQHVTMAGVPQPARDTPWGGRSGYFTDPDGHLWEVVFNPGFADLG